jgi:hypothetical protein
MLLILRSSLCPARAAARFEFAEKDERLVRD